MPPVPPATQRIFDQGHLVGTLANQLYPDGMNLQNESIAENLRETQDSLSLHRPLFEAGFSSGGLYCRVDILKPTGEDEWDIVEVKSTNEVKNEHLHDIAFQRHCCQLARLKVSGCHIIHLNRKYIKQGEIDPNQLFIIEDVTDRLDEFACGLEERITKMLAVINSNDCPDSAIGQHCNAPYSCSLQEECWAHLPEHHVMTLYYGKKLGEALLGNGILAINDIPDNVVLNGKQQIQKKCIVCGQPHIDRKEIQIFLGSLKYPLYFMDFETFATAVPIYDSTSPHQNIPFQFSMHVVRKPGAEPEHYSYLADGKHDPRPHFLAELKKAIGPEGTILVYYEAFEKNRLKELAKAFPEYHEWIAGILERIVDLIIPFKDFSYYHPNQMGSASLKHVLPALTKTSYEELEIAEGETASLKFMEAAFGDVSNEERQKIRGDLLIYCGQDTGGMIEIIKRLRELVINN